MASGTLDLPVTQCVGSVCSALGAGGRRFGPRAAGARAAPRGWGRSRLRPEGRRGPRAAGRVGHRCSLSRPSRISSKNRVLIPIRGVGEGESRLDRKTACFAQISRPRPRAGSRAPRRESLPSGDWHAGGALASGSSHISVLLFPGRSSDFTPCHSVPRESSSNCSPSLVRVR